MNARRGKIARLPLATRTALNQRLQEGEPGSKLAEWLNALPEVRRVLDEYFSGRDINEQNLTEWKQGGFLDWQRQEESRAWLQGMQEEAAALGEETAGKSVAAVLAAPVAVALGRLAQRAGTSGEDTAQERRELISAARELIQLRRTDHDADKLQIERERWQAEQAETERSRRSAAALHPFYAYIIADKLGDMATRKGETDCGEIPPLMAAFFDFMEKRKHAGNPGMNGA